MSGKIKVMLGVTLALAFVGMVIMASTSSWRGLTFTVVSRTNDVRYVYCQIGMTNHGGTVRYHGYDRSSPVYSLVHKTDKGETTNSMFWCGTGMQEVSLRDGEGAQFSIGFTASNAPSRVIFHYRERSLFDSILEKAPTFVREKLQRPDFRTASVSLHE
jgi:hypothetical protein